MGVYIKNEIMPGSCYECFARTDVNIGVGIADGCVLLKQMISNATERCPDCPLVEVPEHGRLVDADKLEETMDFALQQVNAYLDNLDADYYSAEYREMEARAECYRDALEYIRTAQTVIPKEEA